MNVAPSKKMATDIVARVFIFMAVSLSGAVFFKLFIRNVFVVDRGGLKADDAELAGADQNGAGAVSYTHLDVYKRQTLGPL